MLLIGNSSTQKTHYDVFSVKEDASYDQIRLNYKAAVLKYHQAKLQTKTKATDVQDEFINVPREVLSDSMLRANYDKELRASRREVDVAANGIRLDEMSVEDSNGSKKFFYDCYCRCGEYFSVSDTDQETMGISLCENATEVCLGEGILPASVLPCGSCSLKIQLILDASG